MSVLCAWFLSKENGSNNFNTQIFNIFNNETWKMNHSLTKKYDNFIQLMNVFAKKVNKLYVVKLQITFHDHTILLVHVSAMRKMKF